MNNAELGMRNAEHSTEEGGTRTAEYSNAESGTQNGKLIPPSAFRVPRSDIPTSAFPVPRSDTSHAVELHIEELVLHGFSPGDRHRIGEAVERELARLFAEQGVLPSLAAGGEVARLDGGSFKVSPNSKAEAIGTQIAQAVYGVLDR